MRHPLLNIAGICLVLAQCLLTEASAHQIDPPSSSPSLTFLTDDNWQYSFLNNATGKMEGIAVDLVDAIMSKAGISYSIQKVAFRRSMRDIRANANTCGFVVTRTKERENDYKWVGPLYIGGWSIQSTDSNIKINSLDELKKYNVAVLWQHQASKNFLEENGISTIAAEDWPGLIRLLENQRAVISLMGPQMAEMHNLKKQKPPLFQVYSIRETNLSLACNKDMDDALIARLNKINTDIGDDRLAFFTKY